MNNKEIKHIITGISIKEQMGKATKILNDIVIPRNTLYQKLKQK